MPLKRELLEILVCPVDKQPIKELPNDSGLQCTSCGRVYPIQDGIPIMLRDRAQMPQS